MVIQGPGKNGAGFMVSLWTGMRKQEQKLIVSGYQPSVWRHVRLSHSYAQLSRKTDSASFEGLGRTSPKSWTVVLVVINILVV